MPMDTTKMILVGEANLTSYKGEKTIIKVFAKDENSKKIENFTSRIFYENGKVKCMGCFFGLTNGIRLLGLRQKSMEITKINQHLFNHLREMINLEFQLDIGETIPTQMCVYGFMREKYDETTIISSLKFNLQ